jgi:hypothetical protein
MKTSSSACSEGNYRHHSVIPQHSLPGYSPLPARVSEESPANFATAVAKLELPAQVHAPLPIHLPTSAPLGVTGAGHLLKYMERSPYTCLKKGSFKSLMK